MATANNKRIEETATTALKAALLRCPILESYIDSNDKTPSWDGTVFVYRNGSQKKADLLGRVPIQIKGTEKVFLSDTVSFSCNVEDLRNYYNDGGCVFFLLSVNPSNGNSKIYYVSLLVYDLKKLLDAAENQKTKSLELTAFPVDDINEMSAIFMSFVENSRKQISFIGKDFLSIEQLKERGISIESLTINASGLGLDLVSIGNFISSHDFYLYAKPKGLNIEIPVDKVKDAIISRPINGKVCVKDVEYYSSYCIVSQRGQSQFRIGKGISLSINEKTNERAQKLTWSFKATGTLSDYILDGNCFISAVKNKEITLNGVRIAFHGANDIDLDNYIKQLQYYEDIKKMLDILGVTEELQISRLSQEDVKNIRNFVNATLHNKRIGFPGVDDSTIYGSFKIANLSIWIWAIKKDDGYYQLDSFFSPHQLTIFESSDTEQVNPVSASQYLLLTKDAFVHASNMDYEKIKSDIRSMEHHPLLLDATTYLLLNILQGYDLRTNKDAALLDLADSICSWIANYGEKINAQILKLNQLQIAKRKRNLEISEILELGKLTEKSNDPNIRCGAYLLLGDLENAQLSFDEIPPEFQEEFLTYPICHFGALKTKEGESNG